MRDDGSGMFELDGATLLELDADDAISSQAIGFTADDSALYVITPASANAAGLVQVAPGSVTRDARRRPDLRRRRGRAPPRHPQGRDRELPARAARAPGARSRARARHRRDHRAPPRRRVPDLARPRRPHVDGRVHRRRRPRGLLRVRPRRAGRALPLHAARRPRPVPALADGAVRVHGPRRARDPRLPDLPARRAPAGPPHRALRARRAVGARHVGLRRRPRSGSPTAATCACR